MSEHEEPLFFAELARPAGGQVTIRTRDHGLVTIDEPAWCQGPHPQDTFREDICHQAEDTYMVFDAGQAEGPGELFTSYLTQRPFSPTRPGLYLSVDLGGDDIELDPAGVDRLAAALVEHASVLRAAARRLAVLRAAR